MKTTKDIIESSLFICLTYAIVFFAGFFWHWFITIT